MSETLRLYTHLPHPLIVNEAIRRVENAYIHRNDFRTEGKNDPRTNVPDECGYPRHDVALRIEDLYPEWRRDPIARRVVNIWPKECWQIAPEIIEDEDPDNKTPFEEAWGMVGTQIRGNSHYEDQGNSVWEICKRADELSGIGQYGVILIGLNDGQDLSTPVPGVEEKHSMPSVLDPKEQSSDNEGEEDEEDETEKKKKRIPVRNEKPTGVYNLFKNEEKITGKRQITYMRVFPEVLARISSYETNITSHRYGHPVTYNITFTDPYRSDYSTSTTGEPQFSMEVHWTRVVHIADNIESSEIHGTPRMEPVWDRLLDLQKIYGASGECYWRNAVLKLFFQTHPQLGGDVLVNKSNMRSEIEQMMNGLQQWMLLKGMEAKSIAPAVADPGPFVDAQIEAICIELEIPIRIFRGSERGELASSQDKNSWNERVQGRRNNYLSPRVIAPLIDHLILLGILPTPQERYRVIWPELGKQTEEEKATIAEKRVKALASYISGGLDQLIMPDDFMEVLLGMEEEEVDMIMENIQKHLEKLEKEGKIDAEGNALDDEGNPIEVDDEGNPIPPAESSTGTETEEGGSSGGGSEGSETSEGEGERTEEGGEDADDVTDEDLDKTINDPESTELEDEEDEEGTETDGDDGEGEEDDEEKEATTEDIQELIDNPEDLDPDDLELEDIEEDEQSADEDDASKEDEEEDEKDKKTGKKAK